VIKLIDTALFDEVSAEARTAPRGRKNRNFHPRDDYPGHRLLNAIEPGSYIAPHRHLDPHKDETMVVLRGMLGLVVFDDAGRVSQVQKVGAGGTASAVSAANTGTPHGVVGIDIPHGTWHTVFALEPGTVFLEAKSGPYLPLAEAERAPWAPAENAADAPAYLAGLVQLFT
jgi:cupin fold WbuC family metalloprotein